jgi:hypothetical protein
MTNDYRSRWVAILILEQCKWWLLANSAQLTPFIYFIDLWAAADGNRRNETIYVGGILGGFLYSWMAVTCTQKIGRLFRADFFLMEGIYFFYFFYFLVMYCTFHGQNF